MSCSQIRLPGDHDGRAGTAQFGQIAICGHAEPECRAFPANDRTIRVRLQQCALQASPSGASAVARVPELAMIAGLRKCPCLLEGCRAQNVGACEDQI